MASPGDLEPTLLGGDRRYTRAQVAQTAGVSLERAQRLWLALGFAEVGDDAVVFTEADVEALRTVDGLVRRGVLDAETERAVARQLGQTFSRLAVWQVEVLAGAASADPAATIALAEELIPAMERLQSYAWRRHLAGAAGRALGTAEQIARRTTVVGFADVVGYTRMTRQVDETELAAFVERFEGTTADVVAALDGRIVKTVGDEVLFVVDSPVAAAEIALGLTAAADRDPDFPELRIGLARGSVLSRYGDVYGPVVNIAARLTSVARPGTVLVDDELRAALADDPDFELRAVPTASVRGYRHLRPWRLRRTRTAPGGTTPPTAPEPAGG